MIIGERRSGIDTRSEAEKQLVGERRSGLDRRFVGETVAPTSEQLALFARRLRRTMRDEKARNFFGVTNGEQDFTWYPDVIRVVEWIERLSGEKADQQTRPTLRKAAANSAGPDMSKSSA